jgi:hypothetical protein
LKRNSKLIRKQLSGYEMIYLNCSRGQGKGDTSCMIFNIWFEFRKLKQEISEITGSGTSTALKNSGEENKS